jgi:hypothetical protein
MVRMRRRQRVQRRVMQSTELVGRPLPPITSREAAHYIMPKRTAAPSTRRRFQASISMPGVQVRMPSITMPHVTVSWRWASLMLTLLLGAALYLAWTQPTFRVVAANVSGNQRLGADEINAVLSVSGQPIFTLIPSELETRLRLNYPELVSAKVSVSLPNIVSVKVAERGPAILWQQDSGYTWIDNSGVAFRPRGTAENLIPVAALAAPAPGLPSADDPLSPVPYVSADLVKAIKTLAPSVPAGSTLIYDPRYGLGWTDSRGWQVFFGSKAQDMSMKLQVYQALVDSLTQRGIYPAFISIQYANAPYYRMSQ